MKSAAAMTIDARWLAGGVGTYAFNLVRELRTLSRPVHLRVVTAPHARDIFAPFSDDVTVINAPIFSVREQVEMARAAGGGLLHCTHYNAPVMRRGPMIVTIPDVTPLLDRSYHGSRKSRLFSACALRMIARRADHIITVSEYSRTRIVEMLRIPAEKISTAYNGVREEFRPMDPQLARAICADRIAILEPFLLYVGNRRPHKNVGALLRAYKRCRDVYHVEHRLVLIGTGSAEATSSTYRLAVELGIRDFVHFVNSVDEATLVAAYNAADAVVIPSLEEGFCLPLVEAMACGTPVACSQASALPEIAGEAAAYFDPESPANIADIIQTVLERADLRQYMRARGFSVAARYTWAESARIHFDVYSRFLDPCQHIRPCNQASRRVSEGVPLAEAAPTTRV